MGLAKQLPAPNMGGCPPFLAGRSTGFRQLTDQPAVFAARRLLDLLHFAECDLKIIAQLEPDTLLNSCQPRIMKPGSGDVAKFRKTRPLLVELHRIEIIEDFVMHVKGGE